MKNKYNILDTMNNSRLLNLKYRILGLIAEQATLFGIFLILSLLVGCNNEDENLSHSGSKAEKGRHAGYYLLDQEFPIVLVPVTDALALSKASPWDDYEVHIEIDKKWANASLAQLEEGWFVFQLFTASEEELSLGLLSVSESGTYQAFSLDMESLPKSLHDIGVTKDGKIDKIKALSKRDAIHRIFLSDVDDIKSVMNGEGKLVLDKTTAVTARAIWEQNEEKRLARLEKRREELDSETEHIEVGSIMVLDTGKGVMGYSDVGVLGTRVEKPRIRIRYEDGEVDWVSPDDLILKRDADKERTKAGVEVLGGFLRLFMEER